MVGSYFHSHKNWKRHGKENWYVNRNNDKSSDDECHKKHLVNNCIIIRETSKDNIKRKYESQVKKVYTEIK